MSYCGVLIRALNDFAEDHSGGRQDALISAGFGAHSLLRREKEDLMAFFESPRTKETKFYGVPYRCDRGMLEFEVKIVSSVGTGMKLLRLDIRDY